MRGNQMSIEIKKGDQIVAHWGAGRPEQRGKVKVVHDDGHVIVRLRNGRISEDHLVLAKEFISDYFFKCSIGYHHMPTAEKIAVNLFDKEYA